MGTKRRKNLIVAVVGVTCSGKSDLAVDLSLKYNGEVVSADSRQVYKGMDLGSGKITKKEMRGVPHHLLDVASPRKNFSVARFQKKALKSIHQIQKRNKIPIVCGGSYFYVKSITDGKIFPSIKPNYCLRKNLEKETNKELFCYLKKIDRKRAKEIDSNNKRRLIRAIEIINETNFPVEPLEKKYCFDVLKIGINRKIESLDPSFKKRLNKRMKKGMVNEVKILKKSGLSWQRIESFGLEYKWVALFLQKKINRQDLIDGVVKDTKKLAKKQMVWLKKDRDIEWINKKREAYKKVDVFLKN